MDPEDNDELSIVREQLDDAHNEINHLSIQLDRVYDQLDELDQFRQIVYEFLEAYTIIIVPFDSRNQSRIQAQTWIKAETKGKFYIFPKDEFAFQLESEAVRFKLTWGGKADG